MSHPLLRPQPLVPRQRYFPRSVPSRTVPARRRRLVIVDDNDFFCGCLAALIDNEPDLQVCGTAASRAGLTACLADCSPEMIVVDLTLGSESGLSLAAELRQQHVDVPFFFISSLAAPPTKLLKQIGRCGFGWKNDEAGNFLRQLRRALARSEPLGRKSRLTSVARG